MMTRRIVHVLAVLFAAAGLSIATPASASAQGGDNNAIAINTKDGSTVFKLSFAIRHVMSDVVDQSNAAVAYASCTDCTTVAIAIEIVLVEGSPSTVTPTNIAFAYNDQCSLCVTVADALQFVEGTNGQVRFDHEGNRILHDVKKELDALKHQNMTLDQLQAVIQDVYDKIKDVLDNHLVPVGKPEEQPTESPPADTATTPTTTEETTTTTTPTDTTGTTTTTPPTTGVTTTTGP
jgi:putative peptide zinc metalloprotease protein